MKTIELKNGKSILIDDEDYKVVKDFKWYFATGGYARAYAGNYKHIYIHNLIMGKKGIDHINGNKLDNRRSNLRVATRSQNAANSKAQVGKAYKGITWHKCGRWQVVVKKKYIGLFVNPLEAAIAYDNAAVTIFGEFARTNKDLGLI